MRQLLQLLALVTIITSCGSTVSNNDPDSPVSKSGAATKGRTTVRKTHTFETVNKELSLETNITEAQLRDFDLYGKFFDKRIQFYTLDNPNFSFSSSEVNFVSLCFIDSVLMRKRYSLESDISAVLIREFGNFTFRPTDSLSREALAAKKVSARNSGLYFGREKLINYQLKWKNETSTIIYKSYRSDTTMKYEFLEEVTAYKPIFREIERSF